MFFKSRALRGTLASSLHYWTEPMSRTKIFIAYIVIDLLIVGGVVWCVFQHMPISKYFFPAILLFMANGAWLVVITVRKTPPGSS